MKLPKLTYANVMATLALFVALGGTSYAASKIGTRQIANNSIRTQDIRNGTIRGRDVGRAQLSGRQINEDRLTTVPRSRFAETLAGQKPEAFKQRCPGGTVGLRGVCFETTLRSPESALVATGVCSNSSRRLATLGELDAYRLAGRSLAGGTGEWTSELAGSAGAPTVTSALAYRSDGSPTWASAAAGTSRPFRCVTDPRD